MMLKETQKYINCKGRLVDVSKPLIMGIMNVTPDSFFDGGKYPTSDDQERRVEDMIGEGMDILDIGAYSSRPGAKQISQEEEWSRLEPLLKRIQNKFENQLLSIDTFRSEIARRAVEDYGVSMVNDISAGSLDDQMFDTITQLQVPYIMMHMKGTPLTMQDNPQYTDMMSEIFLFFNLRIKTLRDRGLRDIIIDPGFGFGKTLDQNYELLGKLDQFKVFNLPILVGLSRKSMIYKFLDQNASEALEGTIALQVIALQKGAQIIRTHDIAAANICRKMVKKVSVF